MTDFYTLSVVGFFIVVGIIIYIDRKRIDFNYILIMRRTKRFGNFINYIACLHPDFWKKFASIGVIICFIAMIFGIYSILIQDSLIVSGAIKEAPAKLILPSISSEGSSGTGYMLIPFWFWMIIIFSILVPHELMHGIIARAEKIPLKSVGLMLFAIFPGAFVEPDDSRLNKSELKTRLRVFCAGTFANIITSFLILLFVSFLVWPMAFEKGIRLESVNATSPAELAGLKANMSLVEINGKPIEASYCEGTFGLFGSVFSPIVCLREFASYFKGGYLTDEAEVKEGDVVILKDSDGKTYNVEMGWDNEKDRAFMGIIYTPILKTNSVSFFILGILIPLLNMIWLFSFAVGVFNILPIYPLDGGLVLKAVAEKYAGKKAELIVKTVSIGTALLVLFLFFGPRYCGYIKR